MRHKPDRTVLRTGRRTFLAGSAGALVALPFLESLAAPKKAGAWAPAAGKPKRLIVIDHGHGTIMEEFVPGPGFSPGKILQPIADAGLMSKTMVVSGIDVKTRNGHDGGPAMLTCAPIRENQYGHPYGTTASVEHVIARHMQDGGIARRLDLAIDDKSTSTDPSDARLNHTWDRFLTGFDERVDAIISPQAAFDSLFPDGSGDAGETPAVDFAARRRGSVLDAVLGQFNSLQGRVSMGDRQRLELHAEKLREIERSLAPSGQPIGPRSVSCDAEPSFGSLSGLTHGQIAQVQIDMMAHAMVCNQFDVGTYQLWGLPEAALGHISHPELARTFNGGNYHGAWHSGVDGIKVDGVKQDPYDYSRRAFAAINTWFSELVTRLMVALESYEEGDGTALDNTCILWISDFGWGGGHSKGNIHVLLAGNVGGARLGRHVDYTSGDVLTGWRNDAHAGTHNLAVTLLQAFGVESDRFGDYDNVEKSVQPGPLSL